jgi:glycosyltransferase involved in cell wall biosynthesis
MVVMVNPNGYRIVSSVAISGENPYTRLFYEALAPWGVQTTGPFEATRPWLEDHENEFDALHFHWPEWVVQRDSPWVRRICGVRGGRRLRSPLRWVSRFVNLQELRRFLREAKSRDKRIIWTCHNLKPHEDHGRTVEEAIRSVACSADLIITHDDTALSDCERLYRPQGRFVAMSVGNYVGVYPQPRPAAEVRAALGLPPGGPLVSCVGQIRPYKGLELACQAVSRLGQTVSLIVAGDSASAAYLRQVRVEVGRLSSALLIDRPLTDQEFADVVGASDAVLLPYRAVTTSSAVLAALSLGSGVVASDLPFFKFLGDHPLAGRTFRNGDVGDFAEAITAYLAIPQELRRAAARNLAAEFAWPSVIRPVADVIGEWRQEMDRKVQLTSSLGRADE